MRSAAKSTWRYFSPGKSRELVAGRPFQLFCKPVLARTDYGMLVVLLWSVRDRRKRVMGYEQFWNPNEEWTIRVLSELAQQTHLKAVVRDSLSGETVDWFEVESNFGMDAFVSSMAACVGHEPQGDFLMAQQQSMRDHDINALLDDG
jgi:hypothetical protein